MNIKRSGFYPAAQLVDVIEPELRPGMWTFPPQDHSHPCRPTIVEAKESGDLSNTGCFGWFAVRGQYRYPTLGGDQPVQLRHRRREGEPDRVRQPLPGEPAQEPFRPSRGISPDKDLPARAGVLPW